jgi:hypothetical protein
MKRRRQRLFYNQALSLFWDKKNMKSKTWLIVLGLLLTFLPQMVRAEDVQFPGVDFRIKIAVTMDEDDLNMGLLEYSPQSTHLPLQLIAFKAMGGLVHPEPYLFELLDRTVVSKNVHRIKCRCINNRSMGNLVISGTIDFQNENKPKVRFTTEGGQTYIVNLTRQGKKNQKKFIPHVWLGQYGE